jgi:hypothetical protein
VTSISRKIRRGARFPTSALVAAVWLVTAALSGCAKVSRWTVDPLLADYDTVERRAREEGRPMLVVYRDGRRAIDDPLEKRLRASRITRDHSSALRCTLYRAYEPDRRYVAQFGVERAPAVILIHADGTYHATAGSLTIEDLDGFAAIAHPPGMTPTLNPLVPRRQEYQWHGTLADADRAARQEKKPILVVITRAMTRDWENLRPMLHRTEVHRRARDMIHCRIEVWNPFASSWTSRWGRLDLPAVVIESADGLHRVIQKPVGYEALVRFIDGAGSDRETFLGTTR